MGRFNPGNRGYLNRNGDRSAVSLDWAGDEYDASDPATWFNTHVRGQDLTILDTGANMLAANGETGNFLVALLDHASANDVGIIFYCVTSPNKAGSGSLIESMYRRFGSSGEIVIVQNNRDGSGAFKASLATFGTPIINVPFFLAALLEVRLHRNLPLDEVLRQPEAGYERATPLIAKKLV